jgi:hypothetical protein
MYMRKLSINLIAILTMLAGMIATVPAAPVLAECEDGTPGEETLVCDIDIHDSTINDDLQLDGDLGNDTIIVTENGAVDYVDGDGAAGADDLPGDGDGGNDTIVVDGYVNTGVYGDYVTGDGGDDTITINGLVGSVYGDGAEGDGGADTILVNGLTGDIIGDGVVGNGGDDTILIGSTGVIFGDVYGDSAGSDEDPCQCAGPQAISDSNGGDDTITVDGIVLGSVIGDDAAGDGGDDSITINGVVYGDIYGDEVDDYDGDDTITINGQVDGDIFADTYFIPKLEDEGEGAVACFAICGSFGNDTVIIGAGGVSYSTSCGDFSVTNIDRHQGTVGGLIDGMDGNDTLVFGLVSNNQDEIDSLNAYLAGLNTFGTADVNGETYNFSGIESFRLNVVSYTDGATRMYDDGTTLAFSTPGGVAVCNGPAGLRAATIDFKAVAEGQVQFGDNGFVVTLTLTSGGLFEVHVFKDGVEQINDANHDGVADSLFMFGLG